MDAEILHKEANDCRREAERATDDTDKEFWLRIARGWTDLAERARKEERS